MPDTTKTPFASATPSRLVGAYVIDMLVLGALLAATWLVYFTPLTITLITVEAVIAAGDHARRHRTHPRHGCHARVPHP